MDSSLPKREIALSNAVLALIDYWSESSDCIDWIELMTVDWFESNGRYYWASSEKPMTPHFV